MVWRQLALGGSAARTVYGMATPEKMHGGVPVNENMKAQVGTHGTGALTAPPPPPPPPPPGADPLNCG